MEACKMSAAAYLVHAHAFEMRGCGCCPPHAQLVHVHCATVRTIGSPQAMGEQGQGGECALPWLLLLMLTSRALLPRAFLRYAQRAAPLRSPHSPARIARRRGRLAPRPAR
jgi:hypothetical protein